MVLPLVKGQKIDLTKNSQDLNLIHIGLDWQAPNFFDVDVSAFMLGVDEKITREEDFVFYGQPSSSNGSVRLEESISTIEKQHFMIDLLKIPADVQKIAFTLTIYESNLNGHTFSEVSDIQLRVVNSSRHEELATFTIDSNFTKESAVVLGSLYRYSGEWKFHAVGAGFYGGLADLCHEYGVEVDDEPTEQSTNHVQQNSVPSSPNERFQVVQERDQMNKGGEIPNPSEEYVQLKRPHLVQFNEERVKTLAQQSDILIDLFNNQAEDTQQPAGSRLPNETSTTTTLFMEDTEKEDVDSFLHSLSEVETAFLLLTEEGSISLEKAKAFLKEKGLMIALFINTINEKAYKDLGDNLLELQPDAVIVFAEFRSLVTKMKERVSNEH